ncbi:MAG: tRNA dihydrouridine synthase DusB [Lachnospiraceae bacterium]|nr:tRNA dihydrouridine synthase DusB [Lachnospiraceae bacterium]
MNGFYIGDVYIPNRTALGPMAGITDLPFRLICKKYGAGLLYTEMISAKGLMYKNKNTEVLYASNEADSPLALQLFGSDPEIMSSVAKDLQGEDFDILDINMGCPVPKVVNNGEGSALMKDPALAGKIVSEIKKKINKPVTVKIRKGFNEGYINAIQFAKIMEQSGADAIAIHGRTREEYYRGEADWDIIREVKEAVNIPVIASGDIFDYESAISCLDITKADALMVARGARGNPWVFEDVNRAIGDFYGMSDEDKGSSRFKSGLQDIDSNVYKDSLRDIDSTGFKGGLQNIDSTGFKGGLQDINNKSKKRYISLKQRLQVSEITDMIIYHAERLVEFKGEFTGMREMRKHFAWYVGGLNNAASLRRRVNEVETLEGLRELCAEIVSYYNRTGD